MGIRHLGWDPTLWALAETHRALQDARQQLRQMDKSTNDALSWLSLIEGVQQDRVTSMDRESQGETLRSFAAACQEAGLGVDRRISRAVANLKAAVVMVDGLHPGSTREEIDTGRLRRLLDVTRLLRIAHPGAGEPSPTGDHRPHRRLVPDTVAGNARDP